MSGCCAGLNPYAKGGQYGQLIENIIQGNSWAAREPAHKLYSKIVSNIMQNPLEGKFRKLNVEKVIGKFGANFVGIAELLKQVGFVPDGPNLVFPESTTTDSLCNSKCAWDEREAKLAAGRAEAERILKENQKEVEATMAKKQAQRDQVKALSADARKTVADKPINSSVGNNMKFGSTVMKAPPPPPAAKGG